MNTFYKPLFLALFSLIIWGCATGKNAFDKGDYATALDRAVNRLQANPTNKKAQNVLMDGYRMASQFHLKRIQQLNRSNDPLRFESIYNEYTFLNRYYNDIQRCPACLDLVNPSEYLVEQQEAAVMAAQVQVDMGNQALQANTIEAGRQAFGHFQRALRFNNNLQGIDSLLTEARNMGTVKVLIEPIPTHSRNLELTNEYFANRMFEFLDGFSRDRFVQFFSHGDMEAYDIRPDHILSLEFDDFVLGQTLVESKTKELKRDSVIVGQYKDKDGVSHDVYGTVKANFTTYRKTLASTGILNFEIRDAYSNQVLIQRKLGGEDIWQYEWASFNGDERALTKEELRMTKLKEVPPPAPQELFAAFIDRIYDQVLGQVRQLYRNTRI
ncbi:MULTISPECIES: hypothetical protein [unclassified Roseivirga]|uniref:hypothetical protein n=1 Tax=unclassified Roseivirga TaxID=2626142 RepID=UPI00257D05D3|nr:MULTISPECIES: hypothetical protein [unclassified Roseivirga]|tara:strand:- start:105 stop:1253 length:1149 start_codon:yes stop_codon:yes gene_type:complete